MYPNILNPVHKNHKENSWNSLHILFILSITEHNKFDNTKMKLTTTNGEEITEKEILLTKYC